MRRIDLLHRLVLENKTLRTEVTQLKEKYMKKENEVEEIKKSIPTDNNMPSWSINDEIDDGKVKSFLEVRAIFRVDSQHYKDFDKIESKRNAQNEVNKLGNSLMKL